METEYTVYLKRVVTFISPVEVTAEDPESAKQKALEHAGRAEFNYNGDCDCYDWMAEDPEQVAPISWCERNWDHDEVVGMRGPDFEPIPVGAGEPIRRRQVVAETEANLDAVLADEE